MQAQVLNLLEDLKAEYGLTLVFIAHDLAVVKNISDRVAVMYLGKLCEVASSDDLYAPPGAPYTQVLLDSIPEPDPDADHSIGQDHRRAALADQIRRRDVGSTLVALRHRSVSARRSRSCANSTRATSWRATPGQHHPLTSRGRFQHMAAAPTSPDLDFFWDPV